MSDSERETLTEAGLMHILGEHVSDSLGVENVVVNYMIIVDTLDDDGEEQMYALTSNKTWRNDLKMIEFQRQRTLYKMQQQWKSEDAQ